MRQRRGNQVAGYRTPDLNAGVRCFADQKKCESEKLKSYWANVSAGEV
jgi:hypothetical protein